jgi:hypothetical protein
MSRSYKGTKGPGYEYWGKRPGNQYGNSDVGASGKKHTHRKERQQNKAEASKQLKRNEDE